MSLAAKQRAASSRWPESLGRLSYGESSSSAVVADHSKILTLRLDRRKVLELSTPASQNSYKGTPVSSAIHAPTVTLGFCEADNGSV
jgi:hypothetical protein